MQKVKVDVRILILTLLPLIALASCSSDTATPQPETVTVTAQASDQPTESAEAEPEKIAIDSKPVAKEGLSFVITAVNFDTPWDEGAGVHHEQDRSRDRVQLRGAPRSSGRSRTGTGLPTLKTCRAWPPALACPDVLRIPKGHTRSGGNYS